MHKQIRYKLVSFDFKIFEHIFVGMWYVRTRELLAQFEIYNVELCACVIRLDMRVHYVYGHVRVCVCKQEIFLSTLG